jgi:hypothetical protein
MATAVSISKTTGIRVIAYLFVEDTDNEPSIIAKNETTTRLVTAG